MVEPDETSIVRIKCQKSVLVGIKEDPAEIIDMIYGEDHWLVLDKKGKLWKVQIPE